MTRSVLVIGGAGFIGSMMAKRLVRAGYRVVVFDDLSTGNRSAAKYGTLVEGSIGDRVALRSVLAKEPYAGVMHFASFIQVGESVRDPEKYYVNNVANSITLLSEVIRSNIRCLVFSSSAGVYGEPCRVPIEEADPCVPLNPYGRSKLFVERVLADFDASYGLRSVSFRYFNAAGADPESEVGEMHEPETHLIPLAIRAAMGWGVPLTIYGDDYGTADGTCVRDYVHVADLCEAHLLALTYLIDGGPTGVFNLGNGAGYSVRSVLDAVEQVCGKPVPFKTGPRRGGDPAILVADSKRAREVLGWAPRRHDLVTIVEDALRFELARRGAKSERQGSV